MTAQWEKESHWMRLIDLKDDKNFTLQNRWVAREESKVWALSVVPNYFSLSRPHLAFLMWGDTMYFHMHLHFACSTIPEGNSGTIRSLPQVASLTIITNSAAGREGEKIFTTIHYLCLLNLVNPVKILYCLFCLVITAVHSVHIIIISFLFFISGTRYLPNVWICKGNSLILRMWLLPQTFLNSHLFITSLLILPVLGMLLHWWQVFLYGTGWISVLHLTDWRTARWS